MKPDPRPPRPHLYTKFVRGADGQLHLAIDTPATPAAAKQPVTLESLKHQLATRLQALARHVQIPHLKRIAVALPFIRTQAARLPKAAYAALVVIVALVGGFALLHHPAPTTPTTDIKRTAQTTPATLTRGTPTYSTVVPSDKTIASLGGWYRVSPPTSDPVYAFADKIGAVALDVSEQPLPASFHDSTAEKVAQLAQGFGATDKLTTSDTTIFIGTSAKGPQSVIFTKNNLLILIKSTDKLTNDQWISYVSALQ